LIYALAFPAPVKSYAIQLLYNTALASAAVFTPVYAKSVGASDFELGLIGMVYGFSVFASGMWFGRQADVKGRRRYVIMGLSLGSVLALVSIFATTPGFLLVARFLFGFAAGMFPPALVAYAYDEGKLMGKFSAVGSLGFGVGNLMVSFLASGVLLYGNVPFHGRVFWAGAALLTAAAGIALTLPHRERVRVSVPHFPVDVIRRNRDVYIAFLIRHTGANAVWIIFPLYVLALSPRTADGGPDYTWLGIIYAANMLTQSLIMQFIDPYDGRRLVVAGELLTIVTFAGFYFATDHIWLLLFSFTLAASWSCLYVGSLKTILERSPEKATASGLLTSTTSLSAILGPLIGGAIAQAFGDYRATILFAGVMAAASLAVFKVLTRRVERQYGSAASA
jgi:DHA1 family quinolone resistance protein-like MFS transporter